MNTLQESKENGPIGSNAEVNAQNRGATGLNNAEYRPHPVITNPPVPSELDESKAEIRELRAKVADLEAFKFKMSCFLAETELSDAFNRFVLPSPFRSWIQAYQEHYRKVEVKILAKYELGDPGLNTADKELLSMYKMIAEYLSDEAVVDTVQILNTLIVRSLTEKVDTLNKHKIESSVMAAGLSTFLLKLNSLFEIVESEMEPWCKRSIFYSPEVKTR